MSFEKSCEKKNIFPQMLTFSSNLVEYRHYTYHKLNILQGQQDFYLHTTIFALIASDFTSFTRIICTTVTKLLTHCTVLAGVSVARIYATKPHPC
jgi:hypothetical protein